MFPSLKPQGQKDLHLDHLDPCVHFSSFFSVEKASAIETKGVGKAPPAWFDVIATTH